MKSFLKAIFLFTVAVLLAYGNAWALPFSSTGIVYPSHGDSWDPESLTGIARFDLIIDDPDVYINYVTLEFESDIFDFTGWGASDITVVNPGDWTTSVISNASGYRFSVSQAGTPATSQVVIDIAYTLLDAAMYSNATGDSWAWDEGQAWAVSYTMGDSDSPTMFVTSGGSTDYLGDGSVLPEPTTMLLFGLGLAGFIGASRRRSVHT